jgi:predicted nucleotidyltransferase
MPEPDPLLRVCSLLNQEGARYLVVGGHAVILHGLIRTTEDVDILIEPTEDNATRVLAALSKLEDGAAKQLTPRDLLESVVKIADDVQVDVSVHAWKVSFADAIGSALEVTIDGVRIPYVSLDSLIVSKETYREKDQIDLMNLRRLKHERSSGK